MFDYKIKFVRERLGITQRELAKQLNIHKSTYCNYECERKIIPLKYLIQLCDIFNVSLDYLFGFTKEKNYLKHNKNIDKQKLILRLKEFRKESNLTQKELSKILNIGNGTLADYETGRYLISTSTLYDICKKYNISADYLLGKVDNPKYLK